jgi:hypothetical protein
VGGKFESGAIFATPLADLHESFQRMPQPLLTNSKGPPVANIHNFLARSNKKFL